MWHAPDIAFVRKIEGTCSFPHITICSLSLVLCDLQGLSQILGYSWTSEYYVGLSMVYLGIFCQRFISLYNVKSTNCYDIKKLHTSNTVN